MNWWIPDHCFRCSQPLSRDEPTGSHLFCSVCVAELNSTELIERRGRWRNVSSIAETIDDKSGLIGWANQMGKIGKDAVQIRQLGFLRGSATHKALEILCLEGEISSIRFGAAASYVRSLNSWWQRNQPRVAWPETNVCSERHHFRGRIDFLWMHDESCPDCGGEGGEVADMKLGHGPSFPVSHVQVALYSLCWDEMRAQPRRCGPGRLLHVDWRGPVSPEPAKIVEPERALAVLEAHELVDELRLDGAGSWGR